MTGTRAKVQQETAGAWVFFFAVGLLLVAHGVYLAVLPSADPDHWRFYTDDPDTVAYLADDFRASGGMTAAFGVLTAAAAAGWFRSANRWAWYAFWIYPLLFAWGMATTWAVGVFLVLMLASVAALALSYRRFFPATGPRP